MHDCGLIINKTIANSIAALKSALDFDFSIYYFMKKIESFMLKYINDLTLAKNM